MFIPKNFNKILTPFTSSILGLRVAGIHRPATRNHSLNNPAIQFCFDEAEQFKLSKISRDSHKRQHLNDSCRDEKNHAQISHPWLEWVDLMEKLLKDGYFDEISNPFAKNEVLGHKEAKSIRTACLKFARDHEQLIRYLPHKDIVVIAECGCPSIDRKVVNSGKRLRAHCQVDEANVCSTCILRGDCNRAFVKAHEDEGVRTIDVMRILLTYGLDPVVGSVENKSCLNKMVKESVKSLLKAIVNIKLEGHELEQMQTLPRQPKVGFPMKQGDWICTKCNFENFARNMKCLRCDNVILDRLKKLSLDQQDLPLKKGDWICDKCNYLNFARNTRCYQCEEKPPKRKLIPGEWECDSCNYINFRRNMLCLKCDHPRPIASKISGVCSVRYHQRNEERDNKYIEFVEWEEKELRWSSHKDDGSMELEFAVAGGKSDLSQNVKKQQRWKMQMSDENVHEDESRFKIPMFLEKDDDEQDTDEMSEWFVCRNNT